MDNQTNIPLLDMDLSTVDISLPLITEGIYDLVVKESEILKNDDPTKPDSWKLTLATTQPATTIPNAKGQVETLDPGHPLYTQTQLAPTGKATMKMVVQNIGAIVQSIRPQLSGVTLPTLPNWHKQVEGRQVRARVIVQAAGTRNGKSYKASNRIDEFIINW